MTHRDAEPGRGPQRRVSPRSREPGAVSLRVWDSMAIYMPLLMMGALALGTYWLVRNTPIFSTPEAVREASHDIDYFMRKFTVKTFDEGGQLKSEIYGIEARHFPDTDILEIDQARIRSISPDGRITVATANRAYSNGDGSEVQLTGNARVVREASTDANGKETPRMEFRGEFLHAFLNDERVKSHKPVLLIRGTDQFVGDTFAYDNLDQVADLKGRVHGILVPRSAASAAGPSHLDLAGTRPRRRQAPPNRPRPSGRLFKRPPMSRLVFITGASSGIGQALAMRFYSAGYRLALAARRTAEVQAWAEANAPSARAATRFTAPTWPIPTASSRPAWPASPRRGARCRDRQCRYQRWHGHRRASGPGCDGADLATNNIGVAATFHPFMAGMAARGSGTLVGIGSVAGIRGLPGHGAYCASKAAVIAYCESLRGELRPSGVKVVTICPGYIDTPLTRENRYPMPFLMKADTFADQALRDHSGGTQLSRHPLADGHRGQAAAPAAQRVV